MKTNLNHVMIREIKKALKQRKRLGKMPAMPPPKQLERKYFKTIIRPILIRLQSLVRQRLIPKLPMLFDYFYSSRPKLQKDTADDDIQAIIDGIKDSLYEEYSEDELRNILEKQGYDIADFNEKQLRRAMQKVVGVDVFLLTLISNKKFHFSHYKMRSLLKG
jgi:hypothetical protein